MIKLLTSIINQEELTSAQFAVLKIVERSYVINHVANPFIYAFTNKTKEYNENKNVRNPL
jgi:hypothetical protein